MTCEHADTICQTTRKKGHRHAKRAQFDYHRFRRHECLDCGFRFQTYEIEASAIEKIHETLATAEAMVAALMKCSQKMEAKHAGSRSNTDLAQRPARKKATKAKRRDPGSSPGDRPTGGTANPTGESPYLEKRVSFAANPPPPVDKVSPVLAINDYFKSRMQEKNGGFWLEGRPIRFLALVERMHAEEEAKREAKRINAERD